MVCPNKEKGNTNIQVEADNMGKFTVRSRALVVCSEIGSSYDFGSFEKSVYAKILLLFSFKSNNEKFNFFRLASFTKYI